MIKLLGPSYKNGESLNFTRKAQNLILYGNSTVRSNFTARTFNSYLEYRNSNYYLTGICVEWYWEEGLHDHEVILEPAAWGMFDFLEHIENAQNEDKKQAKLEANYNATWDQLTTLYDYIKNYVYNVSVSYSISHE